MAEPKPKLKRSNKRTEVLEVACRCIANFGLQRTNAQLIAYEMGVSQTTIFYYFPRQQDLFDSLFDYVIAAGRSYSEARISKSSTFKGRLTSYFHSQLDWAMACPQHIAVLFFAILDSRRSDFANRRSPVVLLVSIKFLIFNMMSIFSGFGSSGFERTASFIQTRSPDSNAASAS
jgi:AcrR family transcriptional regulator